MEILEDARIVDLYLKRDPAAVKHTSEKYGKRLASLSFGIVRNCETAEECENDTYMEAWDSIPPHEPKTYLYAFLARITRRVSLNRCRAMKSLKRSAFICELSLEVEQCIPAPDDVQCRIDAMALGEAINGFLGTISPQKRNIFLRRYWYLDPIADISKRYGFSESKVKTTLFRTRNGLREYLKKEGYTL